MYQVVIATAADLNTRDLKLRGCKAYATNTAVNPVPAFARRDFYKIALVESHCTVHYADRSLALAGSSLAEQSTEYLFKNNLIRKLLCLLIHEVLRMQPTANFGRHENAASRITALFLELLERLFPIEAPGQALPLKTAQDFAAQLAVHVNHLNRAVKEVTGKPTTAHIAGRVIGEAKALLHHTDWDVAAIGYGLGFEYASYLNSFFKKHTGLTPLACRRAA